MSIILGIDPGPVTSGVVLLVGGKIAHAVAELPNQSILEMLAADPDSDIDPWPQLVACETMQAAYDTIGASTIQTMMWAGEFRHARRPHRWLELTRQQVKAAVCGSVLANDAGVRQALIDRLGPVGTKKAPGPTHGVTSHAWSALAVAVAASMK